MRGQILKISALLSSLLRILSSSGDVLLKGPLKTASQTISHEIKSFLVILFFCLSL